MYRFFIFSTPPPKAYALHKEPITAVQVTSACSLRAAGSVVCVGVLRALVYYMDTLCMHQCMQTVSGNFLINE